MPDYQRPKTWGKLPFTVIDMSGEERDAVFRNDKSLFLLGSAVYFDLYGITRRTGFLFEYWPGKDGDPGAFLPIGPNTYWYDREEPNQKAS